MKPVTCLPETLSRQKLIDFDGQECPQFLLDINSFPEGEHVKLAQLLRPEFWKHQSKFLTKYARIRVLGFNRSYSRSEPSSTSGAPWKTVHACTVSHSVVRTTRAHARG
jgi:hypothetical protein